MIKYNICNQRIQRSTYNNSLRYPVFSEALSLQRLDPHEWYLMTHESIKNKQR